MITRDTSILITLNSEALMIDPAKSVVFRIFDEKGAPVTCDYSMEQLSAIGDDRISAINIALTCMKTLFDNVTKLRTEQLEKLSREIGALTGSEAKIAPLLNALGPTGMSATIPPHRMFENEDDDIEE